MMSNIPPCNSLVENLKFHWAQRRKLFLSKEYSCGVENLVLRRSIRYLGIFFTRLKGREVWAGWQ